MTPLSGSTIDALLDQLAEQIARRVHELHVEHSAVATESKSPWMGIDRAAEYLDWPKQRIYKLTASGEIPHYKHEGRLLFRTDDLDRWLNRFREQA